MENRYIYLKIYEELRAAIVSGNLENGTKMPTEKEITEQYGVSRITAIKAMQKLESEHLISRQRGSGSFVTYHDVSTFSFAKVPLNIHSKNIAFVANCSVDVVMYILRSFQRAAITQGYNVSIFDTTSETFSQAKILKTVNSGDFCGIVCWIHSLYDSIEELQEIITNKTPIVFVDHTAPIFKIPYVKSNNYLGGYKATKRLIEYGHTNIGVVFSNFMNNNEQERFGGYLRALSEHGIEFRKENLLLYDYNKHNIVWDNVIGKVATKTIKDNLRDLLRELNAPTAFFCMYDELASYLEQYALEAGYRIPEDFSVIGYNNSAICDRMITPLMSVDQNYNAIAEKTLELLVATIEGKPIVLENLIEPILCERESVRRLTDAAGT